MTVIATWVLATDDPGEELLHAMRREDPQTLVIGLASIARLLAIELSLATGRPEHEVLETLWRTISPDPRWPASPARVGVARLA